MRYIQTSSPNSYQQSYGNNGTSYAYQPYGYGYQPYPYYNPYDPSEIRRREEYEELQRKTKYQTQRDIWNKMKQSNYKFNDIEPESDEFEDEFEIPEEYSPRISLVNDKGFRKALYEDKKEEIIEEKKTETSYERYKRISKEYISYNRLCELSVSKNKHIQYVIQLKEQRRIERENYKCEVEDMSLYDFLKVANQRYNQIRNEDYYYQNKNLGRLYNSPSFGELLNLHNSNAQSLNPNFNIDDMEISLPAHLSNNYEKRRREFMATIIDNNPRLSSLGGDNG